MPGPTLAGKVTLDDSQAAATLRQIAAAGAHIAAKMESQFAGVTQKLAGVAAAAASIQAATRGINFFADGIKQAYELGGALARASDRTGILASQIAILNQAAKSNGIEDITTSVNKMQRSLEEASQIEGKLLPLLERFNQMDFAGIGRQFGDGLIKGVDFLVGAFQHPGQILGAFFDAYQADVRENINVWVAGFRYAGESLYAVYRASPGILKNITDGLAFGMAAAGERFTAEELAGIARAMGVLGSGVAWVAHWVMRSLRRPWASR